ncbi:thiol:disulfide interchange protein [[Haemophilus] ducreyi]|uniref:Thiol:disulfide interchange protein n=2 Tax=Haemophilus ducreyi TaxID=730 RepID=Q7VNB7_HAEDU|nr:DsbA family protein [[Haemophilus] ducreyi]AAP95563.1 putative thiol:disulfide interchange protein [[Haemophilus] ducreyi 35000HP]AKO30642.1 thiol:disulfide interchange protein [[Haemophilus] ducreyi]AKO32079.1 thiol:disulfide interchange protein [[Haemophilus] ducreyi]AKO33535.1 thiol:disulfide interchange protein [[Haemophilus] ducreyi]AKO34981.1 thiol:disulfide interchange protein [[Haemophilus] ducreyi]
MKKFALKSTLIALSALFSINSTALAADPVEGKEYLQIKQAPSAQKEVIEFFSFYCPHCYDFELTYKIPAQIKQALPNDVKLVQYHINFLGDQSANLTRAWSLAMALGVEHTVKKPLFEAVQKDAVKSMEDIKAIFVANGVKVEDFDNGINSFAVNALFNKQVKLAEDFKISGVPVFFVNGQYQLNLKGFADSKSNDEFIKRYVDAVTFLVNK